MTAFLAIANQRHPANVGHSILLGVFPCKTDDHAELEAICAVWLADIEDLRADGVQVRGEPRSVQVILTGDYKWMTDVARHSGACAGMLCLWCTAVARPTSKNAAMVKPFGCIQDASRYAGRPRDVAHALRMRVRYAACPNGSLARPKALRRHLSIERRPLMVIAAMEVAPMPLHLTLGITIALLELAMEAITLSLREAAALAFCSSIGENLRHDAGESPAPYFGGTIEGRECHRIGRKPGPLADLMDRTAPGPGAVAWRCAFSLWEGLLPTPSRAETVGGDELAQFGTNAAVFVDGFQAGFAWFSGTPKMHDLCCHAAAFLRRFRSLGRYSEQGMEALHGRCNQDASRHTSATFLGSCREFFKSAAVRGAPGSAAHRHLAARKTAVAGARVAMGAGYKPTRAYKEQAGLATTSTACRQKKTADMAAWVVGVTKAAASRIGAHLAR